MTRSSGSPSAPASPRAAARSWRRPAAASSRSAPARASTRPLRRRARPRLRAGRGDGGAPASARRRLRPATVVLAGAEALPFADGVRHRRVDARALHRAGPGGRAARDAPACSSRVGATVHRARPLRVAALGALAGSPQRALARLRRGLQLQRRDVECRAQPVRARRGRARLVPRQKAPRPARWRSAQRWPSSDRDLPEREPALELRLEASEDSRRRSDREKSTERRPRPA